ncbi:uncharacterized protein Z520_02125 [Fonsecaea multimorphosa CBS 102226]|uniref:Uncharacterized protein n=1 Tax=Fonsecaea multimorphosa CBS 102226 TaxID=1442371 RepID=A0A0D2IY75_9EURO|nr:uncharacterized protein Z520_02125 [Fonsecaea multimorphosa CBS 102226]KIY01987.1 hypothetical protein Z520_02125 [Fonsecaea multimorphosa CBS 102226]
MMDEGIDVLVVVRGSSEEGLAAPVDSAADIVIDSLAAPLKLVDVRPVAVFKLVGKDNPEFVANGLFVLNASSKVVEGLVVMDVITEGSDALLPVLDTEEDASMQVVLTKLELVPLATPSIEVPLVVVKSLVNFDGIP